jgi:hypothetical protein
MPPSFAVDIAPIVQAKCLPCHSMNKVGPQRRGAPVGLDYDTWPEVMADEGGFADAVTSGTQPPMGVIPGTQPPVTSSISVTTAERESVGQWRSCGFRP